MTHKYVFVLLINYPRFIIIHQYYEKKPKDRQTARQTYEWTSLTKNKKYFQCF